MQPLIIGNATLYLGDCYNLLPLIGKVDCLCTDPPYEFNTSGGGKWRKTRRKHMDAIAKAGIDKGFDHTIFNPDLYKSIVTFCHNNQLPVILSYLAERYDRHATLQWRKSNPSPMVNKAYRADTEYYIHAWQMGFHPVGELNELSRSVETPVGKSKYDHPTVKPDAVMDKILTNVNADTVIDPFMGTGSTGLAALRKGKKFIGIEKNRDYFNIAVARFIVHQQF